MALGGVALAAILAASQPMTAKAQQAEGGANLLGMVKGARGRTAHAGRGRQASSTNQRPVRVGDRQGRHLLRRLHADGRPRRRRPHHKRVKAIGSVEITDGSGNTVRGESVDLTDDLRDGIAQGFELVTADRVAFRARTATRNGGDVTEFQDGVYEPCVDCNGEKGRKPIWQIRANRIIHRQGERVVTFEDARFEFLGVPIAWVPVLTQPDPSVKRLSGVLIPRPSYAQKLGFGLTVPYFWALRRTWTSR